MFSRRESNVGGHEGFMKGALNLFLCFALTFLLFAPFSNAVAATVLSPQDGFGAESPDAAEDTAESQDLPIYIYIEKDLKKITLVNETGIPVDLYILALDEGGYEIASWPLPAFSDPVGLKLKLADIFGSVPKNQIASVKVVSDEPIRVIEIDQSTDLKLTTGQYQGSSQRNLSAQLLLSVNPLPVLFKPQVPPGTWSGTNNCGQTSSLMVMSYHNGMSPTEQGIKNIDDWLYNKYADPINNYNGSVTNTTKLAALVKEYGGFVNSSNASGWNLDNIRSKINEGLPVIAAVTASYLSNRGYTYSGGHFVVVIGYTDTYIICNDPGTSSGEKKYYLNTEFSQAFAASGGSVVVVIPNGGTCSDFCEPNDSFSSACGLSSSSTSTAKICSSTDLDYYKVMPSSGTMTIRMTPPSDKDYDLYVYNSSQAQVCSSILGTGVQDFCNVTVTSGQTYYIKVVGYGGASSTTSNYSLGITVVAAAPVTYSMSGTIHSGSIFGPILSGATISIAGKTATSSSTGTFSITGITAGFYAFTISKAGYDTYTNSAYYIGSNQSGLNFYLTPTTSGDVALQSGVGSNGSVSSGQWKYYYIDVPSGASKLEIKITNLTSDVDLYTLYNAKPTLASYTCRPYLSGTTGETCTYTNPATGRWWAGVYGYSAGSYTITATITPVTSGTPTLLVDGGTSSTKAQGGTFTLTGSNYTPNGTITRYVNGSSIGTITASSSGTIASGSWTWPTNCTTATGTSTVRTYDVTKQLYSNTVTEVVTANSSCSSSDVALQSGVASNGSVSSGQWKYYYIDVLSGASKLEIKITNLTNDVDLYTLYNAKPTSASYSCRPYYSGTASEICTYTNPSSGRWLAGVYGYSSGSYTITATITPGTTSPYSMSGTIHSGSNTGPVLSGATVSIAGKTATSSSTGTFTITGITAGTYAFTVSKAGYTTYTNPAYYVGSNQTGLNFYLTLPPIYEGWIDATDCDSIRGWAWDKNQPNTPINVDIYNGSTKLTTAGANIFRQDLVNAGKGNGYHGFSYATPSSLKDSNAHSIYVKYAGTGTNLSGSPKTLTCSGYASVSQGVSISSNPVVLGQNFTISFTLKERRGAAKTFENIAIAILDPSGTFIFDFAMFPSVTISAYGTKSYSAQNYIYTSRPTGTYKAVVRGKVGGQWFDFDTVDSGVNPKSFSVVR